MVLLQRIQSIAELKPLVLVGGTALALHFGHRHSIDLDLFGNHNLEHEQIRKLIENQNIEVEVMYETKSILALKCDNVKVDIVNFDRNWIKKLLVENEITIASTEDIAAMKLKAIAGRGSKKDFIDFYFLLKHLSFAEMIQFFQLKFPEIPLFMILKSLTYFIDAEPQVMPKMFIKTHWEEVKETILKEVLKIQ